MVTKKKTDGGCIGTKAAVKEVADNAGSSAPNQDGAPLTYTDVQRRATKGLAPLLPAVAGVGQACLLRQRLQDELRDCSRCIVGIKHLLY